MRNILLWLHISTAILLIGGLSCIDMMVLGLVRGGRENLPALRRLHQMGRVYGPSAGIVFLLGIALGIRGEFSFGKLWLSLAMLLFIVYAVLGSVVTGKALEAAIGNIENDQPAEAQASRLTMAAGIQVVIMLVIVWLMVAKPG